jgi:signal transduction histidine kinase
LEIAVEARTAALEQALAHKQTFISSISHELRTPLYSISGLCAVMQSSSDLTPAQNENLAVIASSAEDLQRIVTAILDMAKLESGGMTAEAIPFDLRDTLESSLESVAHISRAKGIELVLENDVSTDPPECLIGDPHRVRQCLLNLLSNAVKFSRTGSDQAFIKLGWTIEQDDAEHYAVTVTVTDNGIGIPKSKMNRLFHSFSQVDASITRQYGR